MKALFCLGIGLFSFNGFAASLQITAADVAGAGALAKAEVRTVKGKTETILVDAQGRSVYTFARDSAGVSNCRGGCLTEWPVVHASTGSTLAAPFAQIQGNDGQAQLTVKGLPLYYYDDDQKPGDVFGEYPQWDVVIVTL